MGESHVELALFENQNLPSPSTTFKEDSNFHEISSFGDFWHVDPFVFEYAISEGLGLDFARIEFNVSMPPSILNEETYATNEVSMSDYCRFAQVMQSMPAIDNMECDFDIGVKLTSGPSDRARYNFIWYTNHIK